MTAARYRLLARIGTGILADSFRAERDDSLPVVVKLFQPGTADDRYASEISEVARRLLPFQAPGISQVIDVGYASGRLAVVRECNDDFNLGQVLSRLTAWGIIFPTPLALWVISQLLDALRWAHAAGVIHGGIAPGNILLGMRGQPALCDFGALQALCAVPELKVRFIPAGRGSYRSPEVERGEGATQQSDVFSLGAVAYQMLTLREVSPPRPAPNALPVPTVGSQIDQRLCPVLVKSMEAIPQLRYASCADFAGGLQDYLTATHVSPRRQDLQKLLLDLFPEGAGLRTSEPRLPFAEPFSLDPVDGVTPLQKPVPQAWSAATAPGSPQDAQAGGFDADWAKHLSAPSPAASASATSIAPAAPRPPWEPSSAPPGLAAETPREPVEKRLRQQKAMGLAGALLIAGSFAIALSIWQPGRGKAAPTPVDAPRPALPAAAPVAAAAPPAHPANEAPLADTAPVRSAAQPSRAEERVEWDTPARRGGYVSISSDVPAVVYVDGRRVREPTPLKRYPVQVGVRKISVVAADTRQRRDFIVHIGRGQLRKLDSSFERSSASR